MADAQNEGHLTMYLVFCTTVCILGNSFNYGYNIGVLNLIGTELKEFVNETLVKRDSSAYTPEFAYTSMSAIFVIGGMLGSFTSAFVADHLGRRRGMMVMSIVMYIAAICGGVSKIAWAPELMIVSRIVVGLHNGCTINLAAMYLAEISPKNIRGSIGTCHQLAITCGILFSNIMTISPIFGTADLWPIAVSIHGLICFISTVLFFFCPESPRYLLIKKGEEEEATKVLQQIRGETDVSADIDEMKAEASQEKAQDKFTIKMLLTDPTLRLPLIIAIFFQMAQQFSGINAVMFYSDGIFKKAGVSAYNAQYAAVGTSFVNVAATVICVPLMEKIGRRPLLIYPMIVMAVAMSVLTVATALYGDYAWLSYVGIAAVIIYVCGFAVGLGPIPFLLVSELFRQAPRATAFSIALVIQWCSAFIVVVTFPYVVKVLGGFVFLFFVGAVVISVTFIIFFVPETKNKTFDEIARSLASGIKKRDITKDAEDPDIKEDVELLTKSPENEEKEDIPDIQDKPDSPVIA